MTLGEWLNRVILDDTDPAASQANPDWDDALEAFPGFSGDNAANDQDDRLIRAMINRLSDRIEQSEQTSAKTLSELDKAISQLASNIVRTAQKQAEKLSERDEQVETVSRTQSEIADRLRALESQATTGGSPEQTRAIESTLMKLARRVYEHENDLAARLHEQEELTREAYQQTETRMNALEARADKLADLAGRLENSGRGNDDTARTLETAFARLDERLRALENRNTSDNVELERRFERLSDDVAKIISDTRSQVEHTDRRQADSLSRLGDDISRLAQAIDTRLSESERRAEEARRDRRSEEALNSQIEDVRREGRESMRRMGEEVTRLGRSLADRINRSEERSTSAVEAATLRMAEAVERIEKAAPAREEDLEDRLRQSEERTAQRIEDALGGVQEKLASVRSETEETLTPVQRAMTALADRLEAIEKKQAPDQPAPAARAAAPTPPAPDLSKPLGPPPQAEVPVSHFDTGKTDPFLAEPAPTLAPAAATQPVAAPILREPTQPTPQKQPPPTRRAARRAAAAAKRDQADRAQAPSATAQPRAPARVGATADADFLAAARQRTRSTEPETTYQREPQPGRFNRATLIAIPMAALVMLGGAGAILLWEAIQGNDQTRIASGSSDSSFMAQIEAGLSDPDARPAAATSPARQTPAPQTRTPAAQPPTPEPQTATAEDVPTGTLADATGTMVPEPASESPNRSTSPAPAPSSQTASSVTLQSAAAEGNPIARYQLGLQQLENGDARSAAILLRRAAEQGVPAAQYRYAKLLETGEGVEINLEEARRWTERAANAGHRRAMHNLAVMYYYGSGAQRDYETAARWFQEAALLGLPDSQFNLALLFESGQGVPLSLPDAYAWYMISANDSDPTAEQRATALEELIEPEALAQARQVIRGFQPRALNAEANGLYPGQPWDRTASADPADVERAQGFLSVLGYRPGPIDGAMGSRTRDAIMSFEADQGLPRTGRVDTVLLERLERAVNG